VVNLSALAIVGVVTVVAAAAADTRPLRIVNDTDAAWTTLEIAPVNGLDGEFHAVAVPPGGSYSCELAVAERCPVNVVAWGGEETWAAYVTDACGGTIRLDGRNRLRRVDGEPATIERQLDAFLETARGDFAVLRDPGARKECAPVQGIDGYAELCPDGRSGHGPWMLRQEMLEAGDADEALAYVGELRLALEELVELRCGKLRLDEGASSESTWVLVPAGEACRGGAVVIEHSVLGIDDDASHFVYLCVVAAR